MEENTGSVCWETGASLMLMIVAVVLNFWQVNFIYSFSHAKLVIVRHVLRFEIIIFLKLAGGQWKGRW